MMFICSQKNKKNKNLKGRIVTLMLFHLQGQSMNLSRYRLQKWKNILQMHFMNKVKKRKLQFILIQPDAVLLMVNDR